MSTTAQYHTESVPLKSLGLGYSFFPSPEQNTHKLAPKLWPGVSAESESELASLLRLNNENHHIYFNDRGFHNHLTHHLFAAYAMGCPDEVLHAAYKLHAAYQRSAFQSPDITPRAASRWECIGLVDFCRRWYPLNSSGITS